MRTAALIAFLALAPIGCVVDDDGGRRGSSNAPSATVPDSGGPARRESARETFREADPNTPAEGDTRTAPPPAQ